MSNRHAYANQALFGSEAEGVVRHIECPLQTVPATDESDDS
jgi:hypothetical protein